MLLQEMLGYIEEMAREAKICDKCGHKMSGYHYWYKGGWHCKRSSKGETPKKGSNSADEDETPVTTPSGKVISKPAPGAAPEDQWNWVFRHKLAAGGKIGGFTKSQVKEALEELAIIAEASIPTLQKAYDEADSKHAEMERLHKHQPEWHDRIAQAKAAKKEAKRILTVAQNNAASPHDPKPTQQATATALKNAKESNRKKAELGDDFGDRVSEGIERWKALRIKYHGDSGLIAAIKKKAESLMVEKNGRKVFSVADLAKHFDDTPARTMDKWLEIDELKYLKDHTPHSRTEKGKKDREAAKSKK